MLNFQLQSNTLSEVVVREITSRLYLNETDFLTREIEHAKRFNSAIVALWEASRLRLQAAEIIPID